ncbi:hypothetical protein ES708_08304 [subsurface metagenome]
MRKRLTKDLKSIQEELPRRGNIIVENKTEKEKVPELPVLISVTTVSSGTNNS